MARISLLRWLWLAMALGVVFFWHLGAARLWDRDEPRNSRASHEMLQRGDWIVPTFNGELRDHKPILLYWGQMASYLAIGETDFAARLPSAICALLSVAATGVLASRLTGKRRGLNRDGFWSAAALGTCLLFVMAGRAATPDACLVAFSTLGIAALVVACLRPALPYSAGRVGAARWLPGMFGYLMLGLAVLAKGPVGVVLPLAVVGGWWLVCYQLQNRNPQSTDAEAPSRWGARVKRWVTEIWWTFHPARCLRAIWDLKVLPGLALCLLAAVPWYYAVGVETQGAFLRGFFWEHNVGRAMGSMEGHSGSVFFYPLALVVGTFPWSLWLMPTLSWAGKSANTCPMRRQVVVLASVWVAVYVGAFTIASTKLPSYITPCYPGAALIIGGYWRQFESEWSLPSPTWRKLAYAVTVVVGVGISIAVVWLSQLEQMPLVAQAAAAGGVVVLVGFLAFLWDQQGKLHRIPATWLVGAVAFHGILFGYGSKSVDRYRSDLATILQVESQEPGEHWLTIGGLEPSWVHYLGHEIVEVRESPADAASWQRVNDFLKQHPDGYIIAVGDDANQQIQANSPPHTGGGVPSSPAQQVGLASLVPVAQGERFLRPGSLTIYRLERSRTATAPRSAPTSPTLQR